MVRFTRIFRMIPHVFCAGEIIMDIYIYMDMINVAEDNHQQWDLGDEKLVYSGTIMGQEWNSMGHAANEELARHFNVSLKQFHWFIKFLIFYLSHVFWSNPYLVGGLEHFLAYIGNNHPNWLFFSEGLKPPTSYVHRWNPNLCKLKITIFRGQTIICT